MHESKPIGVESKCFDDEVRNANFIWKTYKEAFGVELCGMRSTKSSCEVQDENIEVVDPDDLFNSAKLCEVMRK